MTQRLPQATGKTQARIRSLPTRVVAYFFLASVMFPSLGCSLIWRKLGASLPGGAQPVTAGALFQVRRRVGAAPFREIFELLRRPAATTGSVGERFPGLLICAIDGKILTLPDATAVLTHYSKHRGNHGGAGFPHARLVAMVSCGTRNLVDEFRRPEVGHFGNRRCPRRILGLAHRNCLLRWPPRWVPNRRQGWFELIQERALMRI
ncbi:transposase domain-containing protein [Paeniglutamicibacter sp. ORCA_105]|uniref:transposase domain-containing protein n=1 Tax=Paeniglutamicibacter sp. ORCA_105 TaxID=3377336 RepID=UPI00389360F0